jgi:hypothetical protein
MTFYNPASLFALSLSAVPCKRDYSEPYSTPWAISPESVLPLWVRALFSLIQYASVKKNEKRRISVCGYFVGICGWVLKSVMRGIRKKR